MESKTKEQIYIHRIGEKCRVCRFGQFALKTDTNNANRAISDILDYFPWHKVSLYMSSDKTLKFVPLLRELGFDVHRKLLFNKVTTDVDLIIAWNRSPPRDALKGRRVVVHVNDELSRHLERFPVPNKTKGSAGYAEKIVRFLSSKKHAVMQCD